MPLQQARKFNKDKRPGGPTLEWTAREFLALVEPSREKYRETMIAPRGFVAFEVVLSPPQKELVKAASEPAEKLDAGVTSAAPAPKKGFERRKKGARRQSPKNRTRS
jgi:hypothetical protein